MSNTRATRADLVRRFKEAHGCADCGDRLPHFQLVFSGSSNDQGRCMARIVTNGSAEELLAAMAHAAVVCANCHAARRWKALHPDGGRE